MESKKVMVACLQCGTENEFFPSRIQKFCSRTCSGQYQKDNPVKRESKRPKIEQTCPACKNSFTSYVSLKQTFCSPKCVYSMNKKYNNIVLTKSRYIRPEVSVMPNKQTITNKENQCKT
jgi:hypothetical protein